MIEFSSSLKLNEIYIVDSPFNEDRKNVTFFQGGPNFGDGRKIEGKSAITGTSIVMQIRGVVNFEREYQPLPPGTKTF